VSHVEDRGVLFGAESEDPLDRDTVQADQVRRDQLARETVDAGRHRRVRGEHGARAHHLQRLVEGEVIADDELADPLHAEESGVPLVGMKDLRCGGRGGSAVGPDRAHAADAEQQFLLEAMLRAAAVKPVGDLARLPVVLLDVAVEQQQRHAAHLCHPDLRPQGAPLGQREMDPHGRTVGVVQRADRQALRVEGRVVLELPAVARQGLAEVAGPVKQADADDRDPEVAGGLEVVAGQDAEAAGVLRQHLGDAELGREVPDHGWQARIARLLVLVPARLSEVVGEIVVDVVEPAKELAVAGQRRDPLRTDLAEHPARVVAARLPQRGVDRVEQIERIGMPGPSQVVDDRAEFGQFGREFRTDDQPS